MSEYLSERTQTLSGKTVLSELDSSKLVKIMNSRYSSMRGERFFKLETQLGLGSVSVTVTLQNDRESFYYPVEARISLQENDLEAERAALDLIDAIDAYFEEYFKEGERVLLPIDWTEYRFEGSSLQMRGQIIDREKEKMADDWLAGRVS